MSSQKRKQKLEEAKEEEKEKEHDISSEENKRKAAEGRRKNLTLKQKRFIKEYIKSGNASAAARAAYDVKRKHSNVMGYQLLHKPKIKKEIDDALAKQGLDENFAASALKDLIDSGVDNKMDTTPSDALRGLKMVFQMMGVLGGGSKAIQEPNPIEKANTMSMKEIEKELKKLNEREKRLLDIRAEEGEILDEK